VHHADELLEHLFGHGKVGDHAIFHRTDRFDIARHLAQHLLGFLADCLNGLLAIRTAFLADGDDGWLVQDDTEAAYINKGVGRAQVNGQIGGDIPA